MKKIFILLIWCAMTSGIVQAQGLSLEEDPEVLTEEAEELGEEKLGDTIFWTQDVNAKEEWGIWLKEMYKPYSDKLTIAMLKIVASTAEVDMTGKSSEEILEEVNAAYSESLKDMEKIKPPAELREYHSKIIELYRQTIEADPNDAKRNALVVEQLSKEADQAMTKALKLHSVPARVIRYINQN